MGVSGGKMILEILVIVAAVTGAISGLTALAKIGEIEKFIYRKD